MTRTEQKIPEGWSVKKLGELGTTVSGGTPDTNKKSYWEGNISWLTPSEVTKLSNRFVYDSERKITELGLKYSSANLLPVNSLIICTRATVGECCINKIPIATNQGFKNLIPNNSNVDFLYYLLKNNKKEIIRKACGSTFLEISKKDIDSLSFFLPPLSEQRKIAEILGTWDEGIEKLSALIGLKEKQKKSLMQKLFKVKSDWQFLRFDKIFTNYCKKNCPTERLLSATQDRGVIPRDMLEGRVMSPEGSLSGYKLINEGQFVVSLRSFQGGIEYSRYKGILSPAYTVLRSLIEIDKNFYRYFFKSYIFIEKYLSMAVIGIRDGKQISSPDLCSVKIPYPSLTLQKAIAEVLSTADDEINLLKQKLIALKEQKKGLMQQLLTGKVRVIVN